MLAGMDQTPVGEKKPGDALESQDQQTEAEAALKQRVAALIDKVTFVVFSYVAQVSLPTLSHLLPLSLKP